jgi:hypothetical protein
MNPDVVNPYRPEPGRTAMRPTGMNASTKRACAALVLTALCLAGCGTTPSNTPVPVAATSSACVDPSGSEISVTETDNGTTLCVAPGTLVDVFLHGSVQAPWTAPALSGTGLAPAPNGKGTLMIGITGGFFKATGAGSVVLSSTRPACDSSGTASCGPTAFRITIIVR